MRRAGRAWSRIGAGRAWPAWPLCWLVLGLALAGAALLGAGCDAPGPPEDATPAPARPAGPARAAPPPASPDLPHLLVLLADDLGWNDVGYHGSEIRTPHIDALARAGVRAERFHVQPVCSATRAALLTGRYPMRYGLQDGVVWPWSSHGLDPEEETLAEALADAGYETSLVGKWHLGATTPEQLPTRQGFAHFYGHLGGMIDYTTHERLGGLDWFRGEQPLREAGYSTDLIADEAIRRVRERDTARPLFQLVAFNAPHTPLQAPEEGIAAYAGLRGRARRVYAAMVTHMDAAIGRILDAYASEGLAERTLVVFLSDNGGSVRAGARNTPLRGGKGTPYQGGVRVPALWAWPGRLPAGGVAEAPLHAVDLMPTLLAAAGVEAGGDLDGADALARLAGHDAGEAAPRELLLELSRDDAALLDGDWKLVVRGPRDGSPRVALYDLASDEAEQRDRSAAEAERTARLLARLSAFDAEAAPSLSPSSKPPEGFQPPAVWGPAGR